jgi:V8-like Glu-specific endopeptidase
VDARENDRALTYWTAERLLAARDALPSVHGKAGNMAPVERGKPFELAGSAPRAGAKASAPDATVTRSTRVGTPANLSTTAAMSSTAASEGYWQGSNTASPNSQIGHLFFQEWDPTTGKWLDYNCSGTVVNSANKSVVWTAGHCVYNTFANTWNRNYVFCPGYRAGACALGKWTAAVNATTPQWQNATCTFDGRCTEAEFQYDLGALKMNLYSGWRIGDWVGYHGIKFNGATIQSRYLFGYPLNKANGDYLYFCAATNTVAGGNLRMAPCSAGGGASGGPWLSEISASWLGVVQSVNSHSDMATYMSGPYMGAVAQTLYGTVSN